MEDKPQEGKSDESGDASPMESLVQEEKGKEAE